MKIAFIDVTATVSFGGIQTAVWELAIALTDLGYDITVFSGEGSIQPNLRGRKIKILQYPFIARERFWKLGSRFQRIMERVSFAKASYKSVKSFDFDWVVLTKPFDFFWAYLLSANTSTIFMSGGTDFYKIDKKLSKRICVWVACSHFNAWQIQNHYKKFPDVIYNGVDINHFKPNTLVRNLKRRELKYDEQDIILAFAGRLVGWKGIRLIIEVLAKYFYSKPHIKLLIIGDGPELGQLQKSVREYQLDNRVSWLGKVSHSHIPDYYNAADIGVFPSIGDEAFGITIAEAMSCGLPVIASYIGGIPELVGNDEQCGLLFTTGHVDDLAEKINNLLNSDKHLRMGIKARERIMQQFTWQHSAQRLLKAIKSSM
ncbi:MAG: hypothetical protein RLZZ422_1973 [Pseudomonadota bacterium]|jgi:glycosyltransferase involved in cell wall biosynthesis